MSLLYTYKHSTLIGIHACTCKYIVSKVLPLDTQVT